MSIDNAVQKQLDLEKEVEAEADFARQTGVLVAKVRWSHGTFSVYGGQRERVIQEVRDDDGDLLRFDTEPTGFLGAVWADNGTELADFQGEEVPFNRPSFLAYVKSIYNTAEVTLI